MDREKLYDLAMRYRQAYIVFKLYKKNGGTPSELSALVDKILDARDILLRYIEEK